MSQVKAFTDIQDAIGSSQVLGLYNPINPTIVSADASSFGLQEFYNNSQMATYVLLLLFPGLSLTLRRGTSRLKALAVTWACERFQDYSIGLTFSIKTDHKPLVPLLLAKNLDELPF